MSERLFEMPSCCTSSHLSGLLTSIGGLLAVDIAPSRVAGAAMGFMGVFSYFGAAIQERISAHLIESDETSTHITKIACEVATGKRQRLEIYGTDYPTPDGTCVRDYIHVEDLAAAHVAALAYLRDGKEPLTLNCGYGEGFSVNDVIRAVERAAGKPLPQMICDRRPGDPPVLIAKTDRIHEELDWHPRFNDLQTIAASAFRWEQSLMTNGPTGSAT